MNSLPRVLCFAGPTGAGKTALALTLAEILGGEIVNTDSRQVYADFPIITAQPSAAERAFCPHHLYGFLPTHTKLSAGSFSAMAMEKILEIIERGKVPILVGGTGLYFKTLLQGICTIPAVPKDLTEKLVQRCEEEGSHVLYEELLHIDAKYAARIHKNDKQRIIRALEVYAATGKNFSWWHEHDVPKPMVQGLYIALDTDLNQLTPVLAKRIELMLLQGALTEARAALEKCADAKAPGWSGIGCQELYAHMCLGLDFEEALERWRINTRAYAKRQLTWFRAQKDIIWFSPKDIQEICNMVKNYFK